jgi:hypothetical protein
MPTYDGITDIALPEWVETEAKLADGLDLLGLRAPVQTISNSLLRGITTVTPQIRYLTFRAWIVRTYIRLRLPSSSVAFHDFASRMESAIVIGNLLVDDKRTGFVGSTRAMEIIAEKKKSCSLEALVNQIATVLYQEPSVQLRISLPRGDDPFTGLSTEIGVPLADELDEQIARTVFYARLNADPDLDEADRAWLIELGRICPLGKIPGGERQLLIDTIMPPASRIQDTPSALSSLATYTALLEIAQRSRRTPTERDLFLAATSPKPVISKTLGPLRDGWLLYLMRDSIAVAHECALAEFSAELHRRVEKNRSATIQDVVRGLLRGSADIDRVLKLTGLLRKGESHADISIRTINMRMDQMARIGATTELGLTRWKSGVLDESFIIETALDEPGSFALLPIVWLLTSKRIDLEAFSHHPLARHLEVGGWWRMGIPQLVLPEVARWLRDDSSFEETISDLLRRTVDQHLRVAWERNWLDPRKDVSVFAADGNRLIPQKKFGAGRSASRLDRAIGWLTQLELIGDKGITELGARMMARSQKILASQSSDRSA